MKSGMEFLLYDINLQRFACTSFDYDYKRLTLVLIYIYTSWPGEHRTTSASNRLRTVAEKKYFSGYI